MFYSHECHVMFHSNECNVMLRNNECNIMMLCFNVMFPNNKM